MKDKKPIWQYLGPGFVVAATGVGAGDLIAASVAGARYGTIILWAALLGGLLKFVLNEGIARWQLSAGSTLLEGWIEKLPRLVSWYFLLYLFVWAFVVAGALISFCGLAAHSLFPLSYRYQDFDHHLGPTAQHHCRHYGFAWPLCNG